MSRARPMTPILILPGYADSEPDHWQSHWERADPACRRVVQDDWLEPRLDDWLATRRESLAGFQTKGRILIVAQNRKQVISSSLSATRASFFPATGRVWQVNNRSPNHPAVSESAT